MPEAVIVSACRTAVGTAFRTLTETTAFDRAQTVVSEAVLRAGVAAHDVDDVVRGETMYGGGDIARHAAVAAGRTSVPGAALSTRRDGARCRRADGRHAGASPAQ